MGDVHSAISAATARLNDLVRIVRAHEWFEHKLAPMLGTGYASALLAHLSLLRLWPTLATTVMAVAVEASYVSLVNDLTDRDIDRAAGKPNRLEARSPVFSVAALGGCVALGAALGALAWGGDGLAWSLYGGGWVAFSLYSIPPLRLKARGLAGALADASGAHLFPQLLVVSVVYGAQGV
jgi:4-hydroxybenzoate polyprenyltransferase